MTLPAGNTFDAWKEKNDLEGSGPDVISAYNQYLQDEIYDYYYGQCAEYCGDSHARMLFRSTVVSDTEFANWISEMKQGHQAPAPSGAPEKISWDEWYQLSAEKPEKLTGDINEGLKLFMGRGKCATCHAVQGNPRALGVAGPDLTKVASRQSIAAGWLNHRAKVGTIDTEQQYDNFFRWIKETDVVKPGNLMWKANGGGIGELDKLLTDDEIHKLSIYLQTLK